MWTAGDLCWLKLVVRLASGAEDGGALAGDMGRDGGLRVNDWDWEDVPCCFLCFFREDSSPLASDRLGEPGRLRLLVDGFLERFDGLLDLWIGVVLPEEFFAALDFSRSDAVFFSSSSFFRSSSFLRSSSLRSSVSVSSDSLCIAN